METTTIKVTKDQRDFIAKAAKRLDKNIGDFAYQCTFFCHKNKYDPYSHEEVLVSEEFKKLKNQLISFIRKQESEYIKPMAGSINDLKRLSLDNSKLLQDVAINSSKIDDATPTTVNKSDDRVNQLEGILSQKNEQLAKQQSFLNEIKDLVKNQKGSSTIIGMPADEFTSLLNAVL